VIKIDQVSLKVLLFGLPLVILLGIRNYFLTSTQTAPDAQSGLYNFTGLILGIWMVLSLYLSVRL
jgi:hypothetical protein